MAGISAARSVARAWHGPEPPANPVLDVWTWTWGLGRSMCLLWARSIVCERVPGAIHRQLSGASRRKHARDAQHICNTQRICNTQHIGDTRAARGFAECAFDAARKSTRGYAERARTRVTRNERSE